MSSDGRLDLDDLGHVIEQASSLDDVVGTDDPRPTLRERLESRGALPWVRRHRLALAGVAAVVVAVGAIGWIRHDPRPADDGLPHVAVADSISQPGLTSDTGTLSTIYTIVAERPGDTVALRGITGPGIRASSVGRPVLDSRDDARASTPVIAVLGCDDPRALDAREDQYRLLVRRTDGYGRTVETSVPLPGGSQNRWGLTIGGECLRTLATARLDVLSVRATPVPDRAQVLLEVDVHNRLDRDLALDVPGYPWMPVRPDSTSITVPAGTTRTLRVTESMGNCAVPHLEGLVLSADGQTGQSVVDRTLDVFVRTLSTSAEPASTGVTLTWSAAQAPPVTAAFAAACAGMPEHVLRVVSTGPAPRAVRDDAVLRNGDPSTNVLRAVIEVRTSASSVTVSDVMAGSDAPYGGSPQLVVIDVRTGQPVSSLATPAAVPVVDGTARMALDWTLACSGAYSPPAARVLISRGGRSWPVLTNLDDPVLAAGILRVCPTVTGALLWEAGWSSMRPPAAE